MTKHKLKDMIRGWFVGNFLPTSYRTENCEVACKHFLAGDTEVRHHHKIATEITLIYKGKCEMNGETHEAGDIIVVESGESADFLAIEDTAVIVVKVPGVPNDKYLGDPATIKAVIFDLDGVLVDATELHYLALNRALESFGYTIERKEHISTYNGLPTKRKLQILTQKKSLPENLHDKINKLKQKFVIEEILSHCEEYCYFHKQYMMLRLKAAGYKIAVCSNSIRETLELMLEKTDLLKFCEFFISNEDVEKPKPDPEMYLTAMKRLGVTPAETLIVEDSPVGLAAARASGAHVFEVKGFEEVNYARVLEVINRC